MRDSSPQPSVLKYDDYDEKILFPKMQEPENRRSSVQYAMRRDPRSVQILQQ